MKKGLIVIIGAFLLATFVGYVTSTHRLLTTERPLGSALPFSFNSATQATSSVGVYSWSTILSADSSRGYVRLCNDSRVTNADVYLGFGATSTVSSSGMYGTLIAPNSCYEMTLDNMFYGTMYAIASSSTSTLLTVKGGY